VEEGLLVSYPPSYNRSGSAPAEPLHFKKLGTTFASYKIYKVKERMMKIFGKVRKHQYKWYNFLTTTAPVSVSEVDPKDENMRIISYRPMTAYDPHVQIGLRDDGVVVWRAIDDNYLMSLGEKEFKENSEFIRKLKESKPPEETIPPKGKEEKNG